MFVDSHVHLYDKKFEQDLDKVIRRAEDAGVAVMIIPGIDLPTSKMALNLAEHYENVYAAVGIHPHEAAKADAGAFDEIRKLAQHDKVVAIGETGLDYHYDFAPKDVQKETFRENIHLAIDFDLPLIIHNRKAVYDTIEIVESEVSASPEWRNRRMTPDSRDIVPKGVFHCFDGTIENAWQVVKMGFLISFPGILTFKKADSVTGTASIVSIEHMLLETDAPYMAPEPMRGRRNEPANLIHIAEKLAELQDLSVEDIARTTNYNIFRLFNIGEKGPPKVAYKIKNSLYLNITRRCNADCIFCDRKGDAMVKGHNLRIEREPDVQEIIAEIGDPVKYDEIVFCGYGEPTIRLDVVKEVAGWVKSKGGRVRLNTDGHGDEINKRNIIPELVGFIDSLSISLNTIDPVQYGKIMRIDGERYFNAMVRFAKEAKKHIPEVVMTVVDIEGVDIEKTRKFVEEEVGAAFKLRPYF